MTEPSSIRNTANGKRKDDMDSSSEDDIPLSKRIKSSKDDLTKNKDDGQSEDDVPLSKSMPNKIPLKKEKKEKKEKKKVPLKKKKVIISDDDESDEEKEDAKDSDFEPNEKIEKVVKSESIVKSDDSKSLVSKVSFKVEEEPGSDSEDDVPLADKLRKLKQKEWASKKVNIDPPTSSDMPKKEKTRKKRSPNKSPNKNQSDKSEDESIFKWWENPDLHGTVKWNTLEHNGVLFPPEYVPINVKLIYDGTEYTLSKESEEVAGFYGALLETQYAENETFNKNFFADFRGILKEFDPDLYKKIKDFKKCNFSNFFRYYEEQKQIKKGMSKEEKLKLKEEKQKIDEHYGWAMIDGRKEKVGNFRIEPPGLFRGRGSHPKTGCLKRRVMPEDITINIGKDAKIPDPPEGHEWAKIVNDNEVGWLATWTENVNGNIKYVMFAATSSLKGMSDFKKFEKARELKKHIDKIRSTYMIELRDKIMAVRQRATALWLIDKLALRAGNEKGDDEADTVGCCSLRFEHIELVEEDDEDVPLAEAQDRESKKYVIFDFLGKDSIRYYNKVEVDPIIWKNLKIFKRPPKREGDPVFDRLTTASVNRHLTNLMPGLTAKVFRTHNASVTFQEELKKTPEDGSVADKVLAYNRANRQVAILCNHQRSVSKGHGAQMEKLGERILAAKYQKYLVKQRMLFLDPKLKKTREDLVEDESELEDEEIRTKKSEELKNEETEKLEKRYQKMCEKAKQEGEEEPEKPELETIEQKIEKLSLDRLEKKLEQLNEKIYAMKQLQVDKDENKTTALGTSKINYIDPRITVAWCKKYDVLIEKMFPKTLREKFTWAMEVDENFLF